VRLGIGAKIGGLCFGLVLMAGGFARWAFYRTGQVFVEHELVDLADDTRVQALKLETAVSGLREAVLRLAASVPPDADPAADVRACREVLADHPLLLRAELFPAAAVEQAGQNAPRGAWRSSAGTRIRTGLPEKNQLPLPLEAVAAVSQLPPGTVWLSQLARGPHGDHPPRLLMHATIALSRRPGWLALATLDFELLVLDLDDSPRHITFLSDERGHLLVHPAARPSARASPAAPPRMQDLFPNLAVYYLPGRPAAENEELARTGRLLSVPPEEFARAFSPGEGRYFVVFRLRDTPRYRHASADDRRRLLAALEAERRRAERGAAAGGVRLNYSHTSRGMPPRPEIGRHTTRLVVSGLAVEDLQRVRRRLKRDFGLGSAAPQPARHFALHFYKVFYDPRQPDRFLGLAWAASTEEIKADFDAEVSAMQWWILGVILLALLLVPLLSVMITRPLRRLTQATAHIAAGLFEERSLEEAEQAPDEIGRLAGSFRQMVEQLRERSEALKRLNEELEVRVAERTAELHQANVELAAARDHAFAASRAKSAFLASMSHELRTPLNAIIGYSEMLSEEAAEAGLEGFQADLEKIRASGQHLLAIINDILDHSKIEAGRVQLVLEEFSIASLLSEVAETLRVLARRHGNTLSVQCPPRIGSMRADLTRVRQVLYNLLSNACKFTQQGQITLSAVREASNGQEWILFTVSDTGVGMSSEQMAGLFQEFAQLDNTIRRRFEGTGLGLAISKRLAELMGGTISVESEPGRGSTFTVRLPAVVRPPQPLAGDHAQHATDSDLAAGRPSSPAHPDLPDTRTPALPEVSRPRVIEHAPSAGVAGTSRSDRDHSKTGPPPGQAAGAACPGGDLPRSAAAPDSAAPPSHRDLSCAPSQQEPDRARE